MNTPFRRRMPQSLKNILTDISPRNQWTETESDAVSRDGIMLPHRGQEELLMPSKTPEEVDGMVVEGSHARSAICMMCKCKPSCYTCPRCNLHYCSLACYQSPDHTMCSETFYKESVLKELKDMGTTENEGRKKMHEMLLSLRQEADRTDGGMESLLKESNIVSDNEDEGQLETAEKVQVMELLSRLAELQQSEKENSTEIEGILRSLKEIGEGGKLKNEDMDEDAESTEDEPDLAERVSELDIDKLSEEELWELLSGKEKTMFVSLLKDGGVAKLVPPWKPWWEEHEEEGRAMIEMLDEKISKVVTDSSTTAEKPDTDHKTKVSQERNNLGKSAKTFKEVGETKTSKDKESSTAQSAPPISDKIPTLSSLCAKPSPLICFGLVNALYAYAFSLCLVNNDTDSLMFEFCDIVLALSEALNSSRVFSSIHEAIESGESRIYGEGYLDKEDRLGPSRALEAVAHIMTGKNVKDPAGYCLAAFSQLRSVLSKARKSLSKGGEAIETRQKYFLAMKKCEFMQAWITENVHQIYALAIELWNEHSKRECVRRNMEKTKSVVADNLKKEKNRATVKAIEELS